MGTDTSEDLLNGARVLVVEDEAAISMLLEDMLLDFGCEVVGPAARLSKALEMAEDKAAIEQYGSSDSGASLGDILGAALRERANRE